MNLLVTGANGFIGKALLAQLNTQHNIFALVRDASKCKQLERVNYIEHDLTEKLTTDSLPKEVDAIVHLAQSNQYRSFPEGMQDMTDVNVSGLVDILEYARNANCQHFINFSSGSVYSTNPNEQTEKSFVKPQSAYPLTKLISEQISDLYSEFFTILNLRLFFPYGPGQRGMLIPNLINAVRSGNPIGIQGDSGGLKLCPIYIDDVVSVCSQCIEDKKAGIMNVGGPETLPLKDIARQIAHTEGLEALFDINSDATAAEFSPTLERMKQLLGDSKMTRFDEGIIKTMSYDHDQTE